MKLRAFTSRVSRRRVAGAESAFTMIEIAIALAVIAFALIAIIGILPTGLQVNRDNREETLVNQDARLLIEAIKSGGRDVTSDLGSYVVSTDGVPVGVGFNTTNLIQLLSDTNVNRIGGYNHRIILSSISGALANRGTDFSFRYEVRNWVTNAVEFSPTVLSNQVYEVRLKFFWPLRADNTFPNEANTYIARTLVTGTRDDRSGFFYAQQYYQPLPFTNSVP